MLSPSAWAGSDRRVPSIVHAPLDTRRFAARAAAGGGRPRRNGARTSRRLIPRKTATSRRPSVGSASAEIAKPGPWYGPLLTVTAGEPVRYTRSSMVDPHRRATDPQAPPQGARRAQPSASLGELDRDEADRVDADAGGLEERPSSVLLDHPSAVDRRPRPSRSPPSRRRAYPGCRTRAPCCCSCRSPGCRGSHRGARRAQPPPPTPSRRHPRRRCRSASSAWRARSPRHRRPAPARGGRHRGQAAQRIGERLRLEAVGIGVERGARAGLAAGRGIDQQVERPPRHPVPR